MSKSTRVACAAVILGDSLMNRCARLLVAAAVMAFVPSFASAGIVDDTPLAAPPGVFFGSGNANSNFTVDNEGNVQLGLSAITRFIGPIDPGAGSSVYHVATGPTAAAGHTGASWGIDFSINVANGGGPLTLAGITAKWTLTDVVNGTTGFFTPLLTPDNTYFGAPATAAQNSEALSFLSVATAFGDPTFNENANDTYLVSLQIFGPNANQLADDSITIVAGSGAPVPEVPSGIMLITAIGILGSLKFIGRRGGNKMVAAGS
jgi:hypothetical protein